VLNGLAPACARERPEASTAAPHQAHRPFFNELLVHLDGKVVVVTGGASGIGRALAERFSDDGAKGIVVADLDQEGATDVATDLGNAIAIACDVGDPAHADVLIGAAEQAFGPVDLFCANAGVAVGVNLASPADWDLAFNVNVRAHIAAAERLLPGWLERGSGYFLATASAAGLASQIGSAPYAVTKHAAVAFAEWLSITYGARGVGVSCLCPMGVNTPLLTDGLGGEDGLGFRVVAAAAAVLEPEDVASAVIEGLRDERFLILPHPEVLEFFRRKATDYDRWLSGMRRLQARVESA
jgi:NAD(P)-dependent dehydrogenase (short-subunit alcohol dehydrogenase family)